MEARIQYIQEAERAADEAEQREADIARGNPLLNPRDFNIKRRCVLTFVVVYYWISTSASLNSYAKSICLGGMMMSSSRTKREDQKKRIRGGNS